MDDNSHSVTLKRRAPKEVKARMEGQIAILRMLSAYIKNNPTVSIPELHAHIEILIEQIALMKDNEVNND